MALIHEYTATISWQGSTGVGYDAYSREHTVTAPPAKALLALSSDPSFRGDSALLNPEQLLVLAAASCQLLSFLAVAARARIDVVDYRDTAHAEMPEGSKPIYITRIVLRPVITVKSDVSTERLNHLTQVAHHECYIANSLKTEVIVEPEFRNPTDSRF